MNTDVQDLSPTRKTVTVTFSPEEIAEEEARLIKDIQRRAKIPGFRPGKAPEKMVRARYAKDLGEELKQRVLTKAHQEGVAGADFEVFGIVDLDQGAVAGGSPAEVAFTVDVVPAFDLPDYTGIKVSAPSAEAGEDEVDAVLNQILSQRASFEEVDKAVEKGDYVRCGYEGRIGEEKIADLAPDAPLFGTQKSTWEEAGAEEAPGVRAVVDGLVGMRVGEEKEVSMEFPKDFGVGALAGKSAVYTVRVEEVRVKVLPELNEELLQSLQVKDEAELRERIREDVENRKRRENTESERRQITEYLLRSVEFPVPESGVERETEVLLRDFMRRNLEQGVSHEELEKNKESLHQGATKAAHDRLKSRIILGKIAETEKVTAENRDFSQIILQEAMRTGQKPDKLVKELRKDDARINRMRADIILGKTMDILLEKAERETVPPETGEEAAGEG